MAAEEAAGAPARSCLDGTVAEESAGRALSSLFAEPAVSRLSLIWEKGTYMNWEKIKVGFWSAIGGGIVLAIIGFSWAGWVTGGTAQAMAQAAVVDRLAQTCVARFNDDDQKDKKLEELKETNSWQRDNYIKKQGWATMPGEEEPDGQVAQSCASRIISQKD